MKAHLPDDYYLSEASYHCSQPMDNDVEESQPQHFDDFDESQDLHANMADLDSDQEKESEGCGTRGAGQVEDEEGMPVSRDFGGESGKTHDVLADFRAMFNHKPVWLRAEEAGMGPISPWRETCDVPLSQRPPSETSTLESPIPHPVLEQSTSPSPQLNTLPPQLPVYVVYQQSTPRTPLATLYSRNLDEPDPFHPSTPPQKASTTYDAESNEPDLLHPSTPPKKARSTCDAGCQTEPSDEIIPDWLDRSDVEKELPGATYTDPFITPIGRQRRGQPGKTSPASPTSGKAGRRRVLTRATKSKAKDKIKSWFMPAAALNSQADSQMWLENLGANSQLNNSLATGGPSTPRRHPLTSATAVEKNFSFHTTSSTAVRTSTPPRTSPTAHLPVSPFQIWGMEPGIDKSPLRFTEELGKLQVVCGTAKRSPAELSRPDLDALLEYTTRLNALLTEDLVVTHTKLFAAEDKLKAYDMYFNSSN